MILLLIFWISIFLVVHTYVLYPIILAVFSRGKKGNTLVFQDDDEDLPFVSVIISAYNEESCIRQKIESIYSGSYPPEKFEVLIGSDASSDGTVQEVGSWQLAVGSSQETLPPGPLSKLERGNRGLGGEGGEAESGTRNLEQASLRLFDFQERRGKGAVVNDLVRESKGEILVLTDANVMFDRDTMINIVRHFKNPKMGLVDTNMINRGMKETGISYQERAYISREVRIKDRESRLWGAMMGPFGGCYAIRKEDYFGVPSNFLVDDFYINMKIFEKRKLAINDISARVFEELPEDLKVEFRRKVRIGTGNFQNLREFWRLIFTKRYGFAFLSHKVIRWFGPFFLIAALITNIFLAVGNIYYQIVLAAQILFYFIPVLDYLLKKTGIHISSFRLVTHFVSMNAALMIGFFRSMRSVRSGIWERTSRESK
jgi:cellulose synthase/poly-beta-1,6-N-acetylglucosamine synthase-like glycosyltransferase